jgi:hypothetical protein
MTVVPRLLAPSIGRSPPTPMRPMSHPRKQSARASLAANKQG